MNAIRLLTIMFLLGSPGWSLAWFDTGHKIVAAIAYEEFNADERAAIDAILKKHPSYMSWTNEFAARPREIGLGQFVFMEAGTWPDEIRDNDDPRTHPAWHYIDYPLRPPHFPDKPAPQPDDDVVFGIKKSAEILENIHSAKRRQAEHLSWLIHLVGDIHQPLHCSSLFNNTFKAPEGDRGGNSFYVKMQTNSANPVKLHALWDGLVGTGSDADNLLKKARNFVSKNARSGFPPGTFTATPLQWSKEGRQLSLSRAYEPLPALDGTKLHPVVVPPGYLDGIRDLAQKQVSLAGYRLADLLRAILAVRGGPP